MTKFTGSSEGPRPRGEEQPPTRPRPWYRLSVVEVFMILGGLLALRGLIQAFTG